MTTLELAEQIAIALAANGRFTETWQSHAVGGAIARQAVEAARQLYVILGEGDVQQTETTV